jgi:hypothetical protein
MPNLKSNPPNKPSALLRPSNAPGRIRSLQSANRDALHMLGHAAQSTGDLKGQALRQLRVQLGIDPSLLATQACMSLSQLYELEDGGNSRFYSDSLRRQAGRRVIRTRLPTLCLYSGTPWPPSAPHLTLLKLPPNTLII